MIYKQKKLIKQHYLVMMIKEYRHMIKLLHIHMELIFIKFFKLNYYVYFIKQKIKINKVSQQIGHK